MPTPARLNLGGLIGSFKKTLNVQAKPEGDKATNSYILKGFFEKIGPGGKYFKYARIVLACVVLIFAVLVIIFAFPGIRNLIFKTPAHPPSKATCASPVPLAKGFQSWDFSNAPGNIGPQIQTASIDTLTPPKGSTQTLTLVIKNTTPVTKATASVYTDNANQTNELKMTKGSATDGTWVGIWKIDDTTDCIYHIDFLLESSSGNWTGGLKFR